MSEQVTDIFVEKTLAEIDLREKAGQNTILLELGRTKKAFEELKEMRAKTAAKNNSSKKDTLIVGDSISLKAVYWNEYECCFKVRDAEGVLNERGYIKLKQRTIDCFSVPYSSIGKMYTGEDYNVVFCLPTDEEVLNAKRIWAQFFDDEMRDAECILTELQKSHDAIIKELKESENGAEN